MPTVTTTVTSACASGVVTTQTTTQATPESAVAAQNSGNVLSKSSDGAVYMLNHFYFKNNSDMMEFANAYLNGVQGYMGAGGCTQHAFEGTTPNCLVSFFSFDVEKWAPQQDFWAGNESLLNALAKIDSFNANYWGTNVPAGLDAALQAWFVNPKCTIGANCTDTMTSFNMKKMTNDPSKVVMIGLSDSPNDYFEAGVGGLVDFSKQYSWANSFGLLGNGQFLVLQIFESAADLQRQGDAFTPWVTSGVAGSEKCAEWISQSKITHYTVGGVDDSVHAILKPYGDGPNFTQVYPTLIGGVGGEGRGLSNVMLYFPNKRQAVAALAEWKLLFANSKAKGTKVEGTLTNIQGNDTTISAFIHFETVSDLAAFHQVAYETPSFLDNCAKRLLHCTVHNYGSMTHDLQSTFCGWESFGTCFFSDSLNKQVVSSFYGEQPGDSPVESIQWFETKGDITPFTTFFTDAAVQSLMIQHRASFFVSDYGANNVQLYFKFTSSKSFAEFWTACEAAAGEKLTALVEQGTEVNLWIWGDFDAAGKAIMSKYGGLPTYIVNGDADTVATTTTAHRV